MHAGVRVATKVVFALKSMIGWGEHKVVLDKRGFRVYYIVVNCFSNFLSADSF